MRKLEPAIYYLCIDVDRKSHSLQRLSVCYQPLDNERVALGALRLLNKDHRGIIVT